uniref:Protein kinase domain-containing protein n=1 Tax=Panagrellus redivivus TaxID=6233 RepID=A0A7E4ZZL1_PANRE
MSMAKKHSKKTVKKVSKPKTPKIPKVEEKQSYFDEHYEDVRSVTSGFTGEIFTMKVKKDRKKVAAKFVYYTNKNDELEFQIHCLLDHPNILKTIESFVHYKYAYRIMFKQLVLVMEHADGGTLYQYVKKYKIWCKPSEIQGLVLQITEGLTYIHKRGFIHRDIKPGNILIVKGVPKIADFGLAAAIPANGFLQHSGLQGTPAFIAPEMLCNLSYTNTFDVWSLGVTITVMVFGEDFFGIKSWLQMAEVDKPAYCLKKILAETGVPKESDFPDLRDTDAFRYANFGEPLPPERPDFLEPLREALGDDGLDFLYCCLTVAPSLRYTSEQLLDHPYLTEY